VDSAIRAISQDAAINGDAGNVVSAQAADNRFIQRLAIPLVVLADINPHQLGLALAFERGLLRHGRLLSHRLGWFHDGRVLHLDQTRASHGLQFRQQLLCFLRRLDELDFDRQMGCQIDEPGCVQMVVGAESGNAARHGCARDATEEKKIQDGRISRSPVILLVLCNVDGDLFRRPDVSTLPPPVYCPRWLSRNSAAHSSIPPQCGDFAREGNPD